MGALERWLWKDCFDPGLEPRGVGVVATEPQRAPADWVGEVERTLREMWDLVEKAQELERRARERAPGGRGAEGSPGELREIARAMLPVLDAFDRLLEYGRQSSNADEEFQNWLKAVEGVGTRLGRVMEKVGLTAVATVGTQVDLALHDVVATLRTSQYSDGTIIEERLRGYYFRGKLLRDAKVVVALSG